MKVTPLAAHVKILPIPDESEKKHGGIILANKTVRALEPYIRGAVVEKGNPTPNYPMHELSSNAKPIVKYPRGKGTEVEEDGVKYTILHVSEILWVENTSENK